MHENDSISKKCAKISVYLIISVLPWFIIFAVANALETSRHSDGDIEIVNYDKNHYEKPVDHSAFAVLQQEFENPHQVTEACVSCHNKRHTEIMATAHWTWDRESVRPNGDTIRAGKRNIINNFCVATNSNIWKCSSCHIGYGWEDKSFDFTDYRNVDCLACHDNTGAFEKLPLGSGYPAKERRPFADKTYFVPNYSYIAKNVGKPEIENCGKCHFFGGGGDNVKHGDLSSDLYHADKNMDVHMDKGGNNMNCVDCHETNNHKMEGKLYSVSMNNVDRLHCEKCHEGDVHNNKTLNRHQNKIACQTCHIPIYAKGVPTKMVWDWSTTGKLDDSGHKIAEYDSMHMPTYKSEKGTFVWETNVEPEYAWFNGEADIYVYGDKIEDTSQVLKMNTLYGNHDDPGSKIIPVKVHRGAQVYDTENLTLITPHVYGHDSTAYKIGLDWVLSSKVGMDYAGLPFSGKYGFIKTEVSWPLNHMVAPTSQALKCIDCHAKDGRLANLAGFYIPGRDRSAIMDLIGCFLIIGAFGGVIIHAVFRFIRKKHII